MDAGNEWWIPSNDDGRKPNSHNMWMPNLKTEEAGTSMTNENKKWVERNSGGKKTDSGSLIHRYGPLAPPLFFF